MSDLGFMENIETLLAAVAQTQGFDDDEPVTVTASVPKLVKSGSSPEIRGCVGGSQQVGAPPEVSGDTRPSGVVNPPPMVPSVVQVIGTVEKRKRGRPPKGTVSMKPPPPKRIKKQEKAVEEEEEEDFCFVCLDGGSLVLCDRKGCPKAYHASCVKRDEVFFKSKAKWNCGWHICTVCLKASYYMCYTCPYSLCKGCSKDADYLRVRGSKGFCNTCMKIIMLIENKDQASSDSAVQVDFDDTTSWEYLFKTYWVILKEKLSLTMEELTRAKNPWRDVAPADCKPQLSNVCHTAVDGKVSVPNSSFEHLEMSKLQEVHNDGSTSARLANVKDEPIITPEPGTHKQLTERAVDDTITKDAADQGTIDKPHIDPAEMPKLHDSHVLVKEDSQKNSLTSAGFVGFVTSDMEVDRNNLDHLIGIKSRKLEKCKKHDERATQNNSSKYAAIDVHNVNLIYLRRNLMESLIEDNNFQDKVVGSIVRIRISSHDQKPDVYRLVQVVGIYKVTEPYKIGDKMAGIMLEVLNLGKKEVVSIDAISNQEFTEAECRELDQYARCGLLKQYTLDEVQKKAMALQSVRFDDWLEAEAFRLYHLLDQASKKGCEEEVSEYIRIIQLLKSPEERRRRISEVPEIHPYVEMGQNQETEDAKSGDKNTKDAHASPRHYESPLNGDKPISPNEKDKEDGPIQAHSKKMENVDASLEQNMMQVDSSNSAINGGDNQGFVSCELEKSSAVAAKPLTNDNIEIEKLWHYRDSNGKIQGPFSMVHLRLSHTTRQFPPDMRIWTNHEQFDSLLLTDALNGKLHGAPELPNNPSSEAINGNNRDSKQTDAALSSNASALPNNNGGSTRADEASWPKCWDLFKDKSSSAHNIPASSSIPSLATDLVRGCDENTEKNSSGPAQIETAHQILASQSSEEKLIHLPIGLSLNDIEPRSVPEPELEPRKPISVKQEMEIDVFNMPSPKHWGVPSTEKHQSESSNVPIQNQGFLELLSPKRRSDSDDQESEASETKQSAPIDLSVPNSGLSWSGLLNMVQFPEMAINWCGYSSTPAKPNDPIHAEGMSDNIVTPGYNQFTHVSPPNPACTAPSWLAMINEPIEFDAYGEESVSDLLAEVDAMESQENLPSPTSAMKFAKELLQDCKDGCFSSIEDFIPTSNPVRSDALSSTKEIQLSCQSSVSCKPIVPSLIGTLGSFSKSGVRSSESSTGETSAPVYSEEAGSQFHQAPPNMGQDMVGVTMAPGMGSESSNPGWGPVQGNINLVTVQGNVNLILGGPPQGMTNLGWGANQGTWGNPNINHTLQNGSLPWDGQRMYSGGREWGYQGVETGFGRGRSPWGRPPYGGGGGYSRPLPKGQRVCKFYESGRCKKGALCDYLHP